MTDDIRISEFNELQFKMLRVHKLQDQINELFINPLNLNIMFNDYNYSLIVSILFSLYSEVDSKCTPDEKKEGTKKFLEIEELIMENPPYEKGNHPISKVMTINRENWNPIKIKLRELNLFVRNLLDNHGFNPDKDSELMGL